MKQGYRPFPRLSENDKNNIKVDFHLWAILFFLSFCHDALSFTLGLVVFLGQLNKKVQDATTSTEPEKFPAGNRTKKEEDINNRVLQVTRESRKRRKNVESVGQDAAVPDIIFLDEDENSMEFVKPPPSLTIGKDAGNHVGASQERSKAHQELFPLLVRPRPAPDTKKSSAITIPDRSACVLSNKRILHQTSLQEGAPLKEGGYQRANDDTTKQSNERRIPPVRVRSLLCSVAPCEFEQFP